MVAVVAAPSATKIIITGHGLSIPKRMELSPGITVTPDVPDLDEAALTNCCESIRDQAAVLTMHEIATFSLEVEKKKGGKALANKAWNSLWHFHLLSLCCGSPCFMLYSVSEGTSTHYSVVNRNLLINPFDTMAEVTEKQLKWAKANDSKFSALIKEERFASAMRYYGNSHYLFDLDARIMLLWAGIEGLLNVDAEMNRRIAMYAAILRDGTAEEKATHFDAVKRAYGVRSRVVHGSRPTQPQLKEGYEAASGILVRLLAKCVALGRVPTAKELDGAASAVSLT